MTTERTDEGMVRLSFPGIDDAYVEAPLGLDEKWVLERMEAFNEAYRGKFGGHLERTVEQHHGATPAPPPSRPTGGDGNASGGRSTQGRSDQYMPEFVCPEHGDALRPSVRNKTKDFVEELGQELPASWFHTGPDGKTCSVYLSRLRYQLSA